MKLLILIFFALATPINTYSQNTDTNLIAQDWPNLKKYREANQRFLQNKPEVDVVFMGNSITEAWVNTHPSFFEENNYLGRGISGQTTPQMLIRFIPDVVDLHPKAVVILAGTNDIAGNTGFSSKKMITDNIKAMVQLAKASNIKVILCSILPALDYPWRPGLEPAGKIKNVNNWLQEYAQENRFAYVDYFGKMTDGNGGMKKELTLDGVHPNNKGYTLMEPLVKAAIQKTLQGKSEK